MGYKALGFALLAEDEDGNRVMIYSSDIDLASFTITVQHTSLESDDRVIERLSKMEGYDLHVEGASLTLKRDIRPIVEILDESEDDKIIGLHLNRGTAPRLEIEDKSDGMSDEEQRRWMI